MPDFIIKTLFIIGCITYGLARAIQQGSLFAERNREPRWKGIDMPNEIHFYGWFEPIGMVMATTSYMTLLNAKNVLLAVSFPVLAYFIYWLPYARLYCLIRRKDWFKPEQMYLVGWIKTKLVSKRMSYIMFFASIIAIYFI